LIGKLSPCFFENTLGASYFMKHHHDFFGENPPLIEPTPIRELALEDYSYENLRIASENWTEPVVVR